MATNLQPQQATVLKTTRGYLPVTIDAISIPGYIMATRDLTTQYLRLRSAMHRKRGPDAGVLQI